MARNDKKLYSTGDAARKVPCSPDSLKYYERTGRLNPQRLSNGRRFYTSSDIAEARALRSSIRRTPPR